MADHELLAEIRRLLAASPFVGEGHRKLWARLRRRGVWTSRKRVLRLTREAAAAGATARVRRRARRLHEGTSTVERLDTLWAADATEGFTDRDGRCAVVCVIEHATGETWVDASPRMDRLAAADLLRQACAERFGSVERAVASGLSLRYGGGSCFRSAHYQAEIDHLGIERSPAYHYEPETNGCVEKVIGRSRSRCPGSSASRRSSSCAAPSAPSPAPTTATGCSSATATARHSKCASTCWGPPSG